MAELQYTCPGCAAPIEYSVRLGKMACAYCLSTFTVEEVEAYSRSLPPDEATALPSALPDLVGAGQSTPAGDQSVGAPAPTTAPTADSASLPGADLAADTANTAPDGTADTVTDPGAGASSTTASPQVGPWNVREGTTLSEAEDAHFDHLQCNACGAQVITDPDVISTRCGYCNNTMVSVSRMEATRVPDVIIPFAVDREAMIAAFKKAASKVFLLPPKFRSHHVIRQAVGMYVPFWLFDGRAHGTVEYKAKDVSVTRDSSKETTTTTTYQITREGSVDFSGIPVCGSIHLDRVRADAAEPFNPEGIREFQTAYLSGYAATTYTIPSEVTLEVGEQRAVTTLVEHLAESIVHSSVEVVSHDVTFKDASVTYALLPIWLLNIEYRGVVHQYTINGQTGEVIGTYPVSSLRLWGLRLGYFLAGLFGGGAAADLAMQWGFF